VQWFPAFREHDQLCWYAGALAGVVARAVVAAMTLVVVANIFPRVGSVHRLRRNPRMLAILRVILKLLYSGALMGYLQLLVVASDGVPVSDCCAPEPLFHETAVGRGCARGRSTTKTPFAGVMRRVDPSLK